MYKQFNITANYGIVWNYLVCVLIGLLFLETPMQSIQAMIHWQYALVPFLLGCCFYIIFSMVGISSQTLGVVTTGIAFKLSFVIPVIFAIFLYNDAVTIIKFIGILMAIIAVLLISFNKEKSTATPTKFVLLLPLIIFIGGGLCDAVYNYIQNKLFIDGWEHITNTTVFFGAFALSFAANFYKKDLYQLKNIIAGIILGIPNYGSLFFLLKALEQSKMQASVIFPINNISVVMLTTISGFILFKEQLNKQKIIGIALAILSIVLIGFLS
ncbi:MAG: DMT family transporter [Chitinophagales bacterium]|nr:DMT family transporter [Chitinophagales bacterium]